jgi:tRNA (guanine37-N1)-methyltransferase
MKKLRVDIITIFPDVVEPYLRGSMLGRGQKAKRLELRAHDLRHWTNDAHKTVDDKPFGGGPGMVMKVAPFHEALLSLKLRTKDGKKTVAAKKARVIVTSAAGKPFTQADARRLSKYDRLVFLCGRYEGIDQRVIDRLADEELSIGPYVLTGGELPALVMTDAVARHVPGVLGKQESLEEIHGSFPQYTRPETYAFSQAASRKPQKLKGKGWSVPSVLLSGDHKRIEAWRRSFMSRDSETST